MKVASYYTKIVDRLITDIVIKNKNKSVNVKALWDTGATTSAVSSRVVKELSLPYVRTADVSMPISSDVVDVYMVTVQISDEIIYDNLEVFELPFENQETDFIIGMNIISTGEFHVSNINNITAFSFTTPAEKTITI